jgi:hypothetical protein
MGGWEKMDAMKAVQMIVGLLWGALIPGCDQPKTYLTPQLMQRFEGTGLPRAAQWPTDSELKERGTTKAPVKGFSVSMGHLKEEVVTDIGPQDMVYLENWHGATCSLLKFTYKDYLVRVREEMIFQPEEEQYFLMAVEFPQDRAQRQPNESLKEVLETFSQMFLDREFSPLTARERKAYLREEDIEAEGKSYLIKYSSMRWSSFPELFLWTDGKVVLFSHQYQLKRTLPAKRQKE